MKIALDGACLSSRLTGVGRYFQSLLSELLPLDTANEYTLFLKEDFETHLDFPNLHTHVLARQGSYLYWQNTLLGKAVRRGHFDLFWSPNYTLPFFMPTPSLLTVHDISWKALPDNYSPLNRLYRNFAGAHSFKRARVIFTDSDFSRDEIIKRTAVPAAKVKRIHLGIDERFRCAAAGEIEAWKAHHGLTGKRLIGFLGNFFKRRHVPEIIAAQKILRKRHPDTVLLLIGENHAVPENTLKKNKMDILWLQRLPENELNAFYSSLSLFLNISEYEGFGLPPMEALNCDTVSLLLRRSSLAELYGDLALFVDRPDPELIAAAISGFLQQEEEAKRQLLNRWQVRKPYFSWKRAAKEYLREIESLPCKSS
ncbi:MAG: glycosyltransferase family 4 protein [Acidobacteria bacterium]|nr:glycosyltransferase family 4 protein [Acidobacteriota bacterium]MCG2812392.1 glycosyltransferase family 4 protein [Candidatus Aminicenantes bacterium]